MPEEIQGIEHLISKSAFKLQQERLDHPRAVLSEQDRLAALTSDSMKQMKSHDDLVKHLATFSVLRSVKSAKHATSRIGARAAA